MARFLEASYPQPRNHIYADTHIHKHILDGASLTNHVCVLLLPNVTFTVGYDAKINILAL